MLIKVLNQFTHLQSNGGYYLICAIATKTLPHPTAHLLENEHEEGYWCNMPSSIIYCFLENHNHLKMNLKRIYLVKYKKFSWVLIMCTCKNSLRGSKTWLFNVQISSPGNKKLMTGILMTPRKINHFCPPLLQASGPKQRFKEHSSASAGMAELHHGVEAARSQW